MAFFELSFDIGTLDPDAAEAACVANGALAVSFSDARDEAVLEPAPGEMRLWRQTRLQALFQSSQADAGLIVTLADSVGLPASQLQARAVADRIWEREWLRDFHAMRFGQRLWVCPRHETVADPAAVVVTLDPGLAFGTGTHPSTALCLQWLDQHPVSGRSVVDFGCGSGVLAIAALKLGASRAYAFDIDAQALLATAQNAQHNAVDDRLQICQQPIALEAPCDLLLANILAPVIVSLGPQLASLLKPSGQCVLAGILAEQQSEVVSGLAKWFDMNLFAQREGWIALSGTRHP